MDMHRPYLNVVTEVLFKADVLGERSDPEKPRPEDKSLPLLFERVIETAVII
jgi:hypothetical protein